MVIALILNAVIAVLEVPAFFRLYRKDGRKVFIYYTTLSNLFGLVTSVIYVFLAGKALFTGGTVPVWAGMLRYQAATQLAITFLVVVFILSKSPELGGMKHLLFDGCMLYYHFLCPVLSLISFLFFEDTSAFPEDALWICLVPTFIYALLAVIMNLSGRWNGPYPFLKVYENGWKKSLFWGAVLPVAFAVIAAGLLLINRLMPL